MLLRMLFGKKEEPKRVTSTYIREELPLNPEENPPESIEELDELIDKLQLKSQDIKHQLDLAEIREKQGEPVDYDRIRRAKYARQRTNRSITILQKIAKQKKIAAEGIQSKDFASTFVRIAMTSLPYDTYSDLMEKTSERITAAVVKAKSSPPTSLDTDPDSMQ